MVPAKILIVEDESIVALHLKSQLSSLGYDVIGQASTGHQAVQQAGKLKPDIVLMDVQLQGETDGIDAAEFIRRNCHIPVVYLTAYSDKNTIERAKITEPYAYLIKPLEERELHTAIEMALYKHNTEQQMRQEIVDALPEGVLLIDANRRLMVINSKAAAYLSLMSDTQIDSQLNNIGDYPFEQLLKAEGKWHEVAVASKPPRFFDVMVKSVEHQMLTSEISWAILLQDVTERRLVQQRAQQQEQLAAIGQMAAGIAHDFNNMLSVLTLGDYLVLNTEADLKPTNIERLKNNVVHIKHCSELINQVLDFCRQSHFELHPVDLMPVFKENMKMLQRTLPESIHLDFRYPADPCVANADPTRMQQILTNLVVNARDAMPDGGQLSVELDLLTITAYNERPLPDMNTGSWIKLSVSDTGHGIEPDVLPHIFEPFFTTKAPGKGTGLGLAQIFGIVQQHAGLIDVQSAVGVGTTFLIYLPAITPSALTTTVPTTGPIDKIPAHDTTILIVEDDPIVRRNLRDVLEEWRYTVLEAAHGLEALRIFERNSAGIQIVLTDMVMPDMGGLELCQELRRQRHDLQIVIMTGYAPEGYVDEFKLLGVDRCLQKPLQVDALYGALMQTSDKR